MNIRIRILAGDESDTVIHEVDHEITDNDPLPWNMSTIVAEMLRGALDAYEERMIVRTMSTDDAIESVRPDLMEHIRNSRLIDNFYNEPTNLDTQEDSITEKEITHE